MKPYPLPDRPLEVRGASRIAPLSLQDEEWWDDARRRPGHTRVILHRSLHHAPPLFRNLLIQAHPPLHPLTSPYDLDQMADKPVLRSYLNDERWQKPFETLHRLPQQSPHQPTHPGSYRLPSQWHSFRQHRLSAQHDRDLPTLILAQLLP